MNLLFHPNKKVQAHSISSERDETYPESTLKSIFDVLTSAAKLSLV